MSEEDQGFWLTQSSTFLLLEIFLEITIMTVFQEHIEIVGGSGDVVKTDDKRRGNLLKNGDFSLNEFEHLARIAN